jgi:hypothetical protein
MAVQLRLLKVRSCVRRGGHFSANKILVITINLVIKEPGSSGSIVSDYGLDDRGSIPGRGKGFFLYPLCPDRLWGPPSLLYNGYRGYFPRG